MAAYEACVSSIDESLSEQEKTAQLVACIAGEVTSGVDTFFLIYAASLVFFMQAGFAMLCAGAVQKKNVQNVSSNMYTTTCSRCEDRRTDATYGDRKPVQSLNICICRQ